MRRVLLAPVGFALLLAVPACASHSTSAPAAASDQGAPPAAPASVSCGSFAASANASTRAALFGQLTANPWANQYYPGSSTLSVTFEASGSYRIMHPPQYSPNGGTTSAALESGKWNFAAIDAQSGVVCLDGAGAPATHDGGAENLPSVLHFSFNPNQSNGIAIGPYYLEAASAISGSATGTADTLPNVTVSPGFAALAGVQWKKTNAFDATLTPSTIAFDQSGRYTSTIDGASCPYTGFISFDRDTLLPGQDYSAVVNGGGNPCPNGSSAGLQGAIVPGFFDDLLVLGQGTYRRADAANGKPNAFVFDPYGHSVRVYGTYDGALKAGAATTISLTFENTDVSLSRTLGTFDATLQPAKVQYGQAQTAGKVVPVGTVDLGGVTLAPGEKHYATLAVTPPAAGDTFAFAMRFTFTDSLKKYDGAHTFITAIAP
jgi:hypothetical protein